MKVSENLSILFFLETKEASQNGKTPIYIRITVNGQRKEFSTGIKIDLALWDHSASRVIGKTPPILAINNQLTQAKANLERHYLILTTQYEYVTADLLKKTYKGEFKKPEVEKVLERTICQVCNYKISIFTKQAKKNLRSPNTLKRWRTTKVKIRHFLKHTFKKWDVPLSEFKFKHAQDMLNYLTLEEDLYLPASIEHISQCLAEIFYLQFFKVKAEKFRDNRYHFRISRASTFFNLA